jgi:hypothetical protein
MKERAVLNSDYKIDEAMRYNFRVHLVPLGCLFIQSIANDSAFDLVGNSGDIFLPSSSFFTLGNSSAK